MPTNPPRDAPEHVCGLQGYQRGSTPDPICPACAAAPLGSARALAEVVADWRARAAAHPETYNNQHDPEVAFYRGLGVAADELEAALSRLSADVERLTRERDEALRVLNPVSPHESLVGAIRNLQQAHISERDNANEAEAREQRLRDALKEFGQHDESCLKGQARHDCTCGLDAALKDQP